MSPKTIPLYLEGEGRGEGERRQAPARPSAVRCSRFSVLVFTVLPLLAFGHGSEFIEAKFFFDRSGTAHLEITADYSGNPMIADANEARAALDDILRVKIGDTEHKLTDLAPVKLEPRDQPDPTSPMPRAPEFQSMKHELLTALWQWRPTGEKLQFTVPQGRAHSLVFWMQEVGVKEPRWVMLIAGDDTPEITVPARPISQTWGIEFAGFALLLVCALLFFKGSLLRQPK